MAKKRRSPAHRDNGGGAKKGLVGTGQRRKPSKPDPHTDQDQAPIPADPPIAVNPALVYLSEKHHEALAKLAFEATANTAGLQDRNVVVIDTDRAHAEEIARSIAGAVTIRILDLDVAGWLARDPAGSALVKLAKAAPLLKPDGDTVHHGPGPDPANALNDGEGDDGKTDEELIAELAALGLLAYATRRRQVATDLGISVAELDRIVKQARGQAPDKLPDSWRVEPWPEPVATDDLLTELIDLYARYVILPEHGAITMALWTLHAWAIEAAYVSPFLMFTSPEMRCGKSTAMSLLYWTGPRTGRVRGGQG